MYVNSTESYEGTETAPDIYISHKSHILNQISTLKGLERFNMKPVLLDENNHSRTQEVPTLKPFGIMSQ